jgi:WD40 repeat protein
MLGKHTDAMPYNAFFSYSHSADAAFATALHLALQRFAKPWNRRRALDVFRDQTDLSANPAVWTSIVSAMDQSEFLVLLASPGSAQSPWVIKELNHWRSIRPPEKLLIVLTNGDLAWDHATGDFDWTKTTALPRELEHYFTAEPLWCDVRTLRSAKTLSPDSAAFQDAVATLAAPMHGKPKRDLIGEDLRQHRRALRLARGAVAALSILVVGVLIAAWIAYAQRNEAARQRNEADAARVVAQRQAALAISRQLSAQAELLGTRTPQDVPLLELRALLAAEALSRSDLLEDRRALDQAVRELPARTIRVAYEPTPYDKAALSPRGRFLAVAQSETTRLFDAATGRQLYRIGNLTTGTESLSFSGDERFLAVGSFRSGTAIVDTATGGIVATVPSQGTVTAVALSEDGALLATGEHTGLVHCFRLPSPTPLWSVTYEEIVALAFGPRGTSLAISGGVPARIVDAATGKELTRLVYEGRAQNFAFYPAGELIMTGDGNGTATAFRTATGERRTQIPYPSAKDFLSATEHVGGMEVAFSKSGRRFVAAGAQGTIRVYDLLGMNALQAEVARWDYRGFIEAVAFADDDRTVVAFNDRGQVLMLVPPLQLSLLESVNFTYNADAVAAMSYDWKAKLYATDSGEELLSVENIEGPVALSGDGRRLAVAERYAADKIHIYDTSSKQVIRDLQTDGDTRTLRLSRDGSRLMALTDKSLVQLFDASTGRAIDRMSVTAAAATAFSSDGQRAAVAEKDAVHLFDWISGKQSVRFVPAAGVAVLAFSHDGTALAAGAPDDVKVFATATGAQMTLLNLRGSVSLAFTHDGRQIAAAGGDFATRIYEVATGREVSRFDHGTEATALAFNGDDTQLAMIAGSTLTRSVWRSAALVQQACSRLTRNLTPAEWAQYLGPEPYRKTCAAIE